jgi:phosphate ABC transporter, permease protein PstC
MKSKLKTEYAGRGIVTIVGLLIIAVTVVILIFLVQKGVQSFTVLKYPLSQFFVNKKWDPPMAIGDPVGTIGAKVFILGSISVSLLALLISTPIAICCAIFISEYANNFGKKLIQPTIDIFVGIPSVVYGWLGFTILAPFIAKVFKMPFGGEGLLTASIVLAVMIFPTITTVAADAIRNVPSDYKQASYSLGTTRLQMIIHSCLPAALPGILTGIVLGLARAFGEALAVSMVIGNKIAIPKKILSRTSTLTTVIANQMGSAADGTGMADSLWSMALLLFIISFFFIILIRIIGKKRKEGA